MVDAGADILVVDDNPTKRYVIASWLRRAGHRIVEAATGGEALDRLAAEPVDLVVLDVRLPDLNGFEVCERIKANPATQAVAVVHISATAVDVHDRTQGLTRGADAYLAEPIDPDEMLATVAALLRYFRARARAEHLATRLARLAEATLAVNQATEFTRLLEAAAAGAATVFDRPAAIAAVTPDGEPLIARCAGANAIATVQPWLSAAGRVDPGTVSGTALRTEDSLLWPELTRVPDGTPLWVTMARPRAARPPAYVVVPTAGLTADDAHVLTQLAQGVALAIDAMRAYDSERRIALTLQHSLLPRTLPTVDGVALAVRYVPASDEAEIGGDFYEVLTADGVLYAAIGDVAGHSLHAATVMAELRHVLRAYLIEGGGPADAVERLNRLMLRLLPSETATLCLIALDLATGTVRLANAGHLPPLLIVPGQPASFVDGGYALVGVQAPRREEITLTLPPGGTLLVVTDGLVERRRQPLGAALERLRETAGTVEPDLEAFCDRLLAEFLTGPNADDVAILAMRRSAG
jgi:CheY-like chemotaxis protein/serine phosphatase RsbU (regulator of sigma subunit)